jgi:hypothetical protein
LATIAEFTVPYTSELRRTVALRLLWRTNGKWVLAFGLFLVAFGVLEFLVAEPYLGGLLIFLGISNPVLVVITALRRARRSSLMDGEFRFVADDVLGLRTTGPLVDQTLGWQAYQYARRDGQFLYLHLSRTRAQVIPLGAGPGVAALCQWLERRGLLTTS